MAYGTYDDILDLGYIPEEDLAALHAERPGRIAKLFAKWSGHADTLFRDRYSVPLVTVPPEVTAHIVSLVVYDLYVMRGFPSIPEGSDVVKAIKDAAELAHKWLDMIASGAARLPDDADQTSYDETEPIVVSGYDATDPYKDLYPGLGGCGCS